MTDQQQHPIAPPWQLKQHWREQAPRYRIHDDGAGREEWLIERGAQWGYDQRGEVNEAKLQQARDEELEACSEWLDRIAYRQSLHIRGSHLRAARRPKPPSLREEALSKTTALLDDPGRALLIEVREILELNRRALEALPDD